jgi:hypothetical protein
MNFFSEKNLVFWYLEDKLKDPPHPTSQHSIYQQPKLKPKLKPVLVEPKKNQFW